MVANTNQPNQPSQALALAPLGSLEPQSLAEAMQLSNSLAASSLLPPALAKQPASVLMMIMSGRELGLSPIQSIRGVHIINGKPSMSADLMAAVCLKNKEICEYFRVISSDSQQAVYETKRRGQQPVKYSFSIQDAQRAGLTGNSSSNWGKYPAAMLRARCISALARMVFPDLLFGVYDPDELGQEETPIAAQAVNINQAAPEPVKPAANKTATKIKAIAPPPKPPAQAPAAQEAQPAKAEPQPSSEVIEGEVMGVTATQEQQVAPEAQAVEARDPALEAKRTEILTALEAAKTEYDLQQLGPLLETAAEVDKPALRDIYKMKRDALRREASEREKERLKNKIKITEQDQF